MRERPDPLVPVLGSAVALVVIGVVGLVFVPRISRWFGPGQDSVVARPPSPAAAVPVWICRTHEGVALILEEVFSEATSEVLDRAFSGGRHHYLRLSVCNFAGAEPFSLEVPPEGLASPEGGPPAVPAERRLRPGPQGHMGAIMRGLGAVDGLTVERGRRGQLLLLIAENPSGRTAFSAGKLVFERREVERRILAAWNQQPDMGGFEDF